MTGMEIRVALNKYGFKKAQVFVTDKDYARPTTNYLLGKYYDFYRQWLIEHKLYTWKDRWDCDNFSSTFYVFAQMCHIKSSRPEQGIAVGEMFFMQDSGGGHAVNLAITEKGVIIIEPQDGKEIFLSENELENTHLIRF